MAKGVQSVVIGAVLGLLWLAVGPLGRRERDRADGPRRARLDREEYP